MGVLAGERKPSGDSGALKHQSGIMSGFYGPSVLLAQVGSVSALIVVAVAKTLWTKAVYTTLEFHFPLTACGVSCAVTIIALIPFFVFGPTLSPVPPQSRKLFAFVSLLTFIDISCMNIGLNELTVSVQQTLNAATPVAVIGFEYILFGTMHNRYVVLSILPLLVGAILTTASSDEGQNSSQGIIFMIFSIISGALKALYTHNFIQDVRRDMGLMSFLFWIDLAMLVMFVPGAYCMGELHGVVQWSERSAPIPWSIVISNGLLGGVRAFLVKLVLKHCSALTKVASDIVIKVASILLSIVLFHAIISTPMAVGIALALAGFSAYAFSARLEARGDGKQRTILVADSTTDSLEDEGGPLLSATYAKCRAPSEKDGCESMPFGVVDTHLEPSALFGGAGCYETRARVRAVWD